MELHKRKAVESSQTAADLKLHLDKYQAQLKEAQVAVAEKTGAIEQEAYKYKRMQVGFISVCMSQKGAYFILSSEISAKIVLVTNEMIFYHFTSN